MSTSVRKKFITFADSRMHKAAERIVRQAEDLQYFDEIAAFNETDIFPDLEKWRHLFIPGTKGFGYMRWKPYIILRELKKMNDGDIMLYCDAGCHIRASAKKRFLEYMDMLAEDSLGLKLFRVEEKYEGKPCLEKEWTKGDVIDYFDCRQKDDILNSLQMTSAHLFCRKCPECIALLEQWDMTWRQNPSLFDDSASIAPNHPDFIHHRHDQSTLSLLFKLNGGIPLPFGEFYSAGDWSEMQEYPILDMRDRGLYFRPITHLTLLQLGCILPFPPLRKHFREQIQQIMNRRPYLYDHLLIKWFIEKAPAILPAHATEHAD